MQALISGTSSLRVHPSRGYSQLSVQQQIQQLEEEYKDEYIKPERVPYNKNMARKFPRNKNESKEERKKKRDQAEASRLSRDKNKYFRMRMDQDIKMLTKVLEGHMKRLSNLEGFTNECLVKNEIGAVDWKLVWEDGSMQPEHIDYAGNTCSSDEDNVDYDSDQDVDHENYTDDGSSAAGTSRSEDSLMRYEESDDCDNDYDQCFNDNDDHFNDTGDTTIYENNDDEIHSGDEHDSKLA